MSTGIATCNVYRRLNKPSVNAEKAQYFVSGNEMSINDVVLGDSFEGVNTWYELEGGIFVWSGGVSLNLEDKIFERKLNLDDLFEKRKGNSDITQAIFDYSKEVKLEKQIILGSGAGITIAVLDSGIDKRHFQKNGNIVYSNDDREDNSKFEHGTKVTGLLISDNEEIKGLCPSSKIFDFKTTLLERNIDDTKVQNALLHIYKNLPNSPCEIINLSLDTDSKKVAKVVKELHSKGVILVVAAGNGDGTSNSLADLNEYVITVGTFFQHNFKHHIQNGFNNNYKVWFSNQNVRTTGLYPISSTKFSDVSAYTALITGLISKYLSNNNQIKPGERFKMVSEFISDVSFEISLENLTSSTFLKPYKYEKK
jgi:subtilisin family serine protease